MRQFKKRIATGFASIEMLIVTPILLLVAMGIFELTQLLQANSIVVGVSREGANLIARSSTETPQNVMDVVASTSTPLDLSRDGAIFISLVVGQKDKPPYISNQYKWNNAGLTVNSSTWPGCTSWDKEGSCNMSDPKPTLSNFHLTLDDSESVYVVEVFYHYEPISSFVFENDFTIREITYL